MDKTFYSWYPDQRATMIKRIEASSPEKAATKAGATLPLQGFTLTDKQWTSQDAVLIIEGDDELKEVFFSRLSHCFSRSKTEPREARLTMTPVFKSS